MKLTTVRRRARNTLSRRRSSQLVPRNPSFSLLAGHSGDLCTKWYTGPENAQVFARPFGAIPRHCGWMYVIYFTLFRSSPSRHDLYSIKTIRIDRSALCSVSTATWATCRRRPACFFDYPVPVLRRAATAHARRWGICPIPSGGDEHPTCEHEHQPAANSAPPEATVRQQLWSAGCSGSAEAVIGDRRNFTEAVNAYTEKEPAEKNRGLPGPS